MQILCYRHLDHEIKCQKKYTQIHTHFELCFVHHFAFDNGTIFNIALWQISSQIKRCFHANKCLKWFLF